MSAQNQKSDVVALNSDHLSAEIDGEIVVMNIASGRYVSIGGPGVFLFQMLSEGPRPIEELCLGARDRYEVEEAQCATEVEAFVQRLCDEGLAVRTAS